MLLEILWDFVVFCVRILICNYEEIDTTKSSQEIY